MAIAAPSSVLVSDFSSSSDAAAAAWSIFWPRVMMGDLDKRTGLASSTVSGATKVATACWMTGATILYSVTGLGSRLGTDGTGEEIGENTSDPSWDDASDASESGETARMVAGAGRFVPGRPRYLGSMSSSGIIRKLSNKALGACACATGMGMSTPLASRSASGLDV
jgi:hypothetical protein